MCEVIGDNSTSNKMQFEASDNFIDIQQRIILPENYNSNAQIVRLKIKMPRIIFMDKPKLNDELLQISIDKNSTTTLDTNQIHSVEKVAENSISTPKFNYKNYISPLNKSCCGIDPKKFTEIPIFDLKRSMSNVNVMGNVREKIDFYENYAFRPDKNGRNNLQTSFQFHSTDPSSEDSEIIKQLVLERYREALQNCLEKSLLRRKKFYDDEVDNNSDSGNNSSMNSTQNSEISFGKFKEHEISSSTSNYNLDNIEETRIDNQTFSVENYDEDMFLKMALGSECSNNSTLSNSELQNSTNGSLSIGSSKISQLISTNYEYATVNYEKKNRNSVITYETIGDSNDSNNFINSIKYAEVIRQSPPEFKPKKDSILQKLMAEIHCQTVGIEQISKALNLCSNFKPFYESTRRIEAEKLLLISMLKKEALIEEMSKLDYESVDEMRIGNIALRNVRIPLVCEADKNSKYSRFFVCTFKHNSQVFCTNLLAPNNENELVVEGQMKFEKLTSDFRIHFAVYSIYAKLSGNSKKTLQKHYKKCTSVIHNLKAILSPRRRTTNYFEQNERIRSSSFILYSEGVVSRSTMDSGVARLRNIYPQIPVSNELRCEIESSLNWTNSVGGFVNLGEFSINESLNWNRYWAKLQGPQLKFWNYPGAEEDEPARTIQISRDCAVQDATSSSRPRTFLLDNFHLSFDDAQEMSNWKNELENVVFTLKQWS